MTQSLWEPEATEEAQVQFDPGQMQPEAVALSADEFTALEERILRAVAVVKRERQARAEAELRATEAEARLNEQASSVEQLQKDVDGLKAERDHVRQRVERLLAEFDALEL